MKERRNSIWLKYAITFVVCAILTLIYLVAFGAFTATDPTEISKILVNGFFSVGILCTCFGGLVLLSKGGAFDFIVYGVTRFFTLFKKDPNNIKYKTFYDYRVAQAEKEKTDSQWYMVFVGLIYVGVSVILLFTIYY